MTETMYLLAAFVGGLLLGGLFFYGLWWTVRKGLASPRPALWFVGSFIVRAAVVTLGFYALAGGRWSRLAAALVGFILARLVAAGFGRGMKKDAVPQEAGHAAEPR
ncbi:MAG: N-ATPase subunit AtpR [Desulfoprunum sp.]|nr:ATPase F0F1 [Desulfobulbus sp. Tol-SR]